MRRLLALGLAPLLAWGLVGCSESVSAEDLERRVAERLV